MPTYEILRSGKYRAAVMVRRKRYSATFETLEAAKAWGVSFKRKVSAPRKLSKEEIERVIGIQLVALDTLLTMNRFSQTAGVYFLFRGDEIIYVGQSLNVHKRVERHRAALAFDSYTFIPCWENELEIVEAAYIDWLLPPLNKHGASLNRKIVSGCVDFVQSPKDF